MFCSSLIVIALGFGKHEHHDLFMPGGLRTHLFAAQTHVLPVFRLITVSFVCFRAPVQLHMLFFDILQC